MPIEHELLRIPTGGRLNSGLLRTTGNPDSGRVEDLNQGPPDFKSSALSHSALLPLSDVKRCCVIRLLLCLGIVTKSTSEANEKLADISDVPNGPSIEEPQSQDMPQHDANATSKRPADDRVSNLELENTLLRKEVASLNEEMVSVVQRAKEAERSKCNFLRSLDVHNLNLSKEHSEQN